MEGVDPYKLMPRDVLCVGLNPAFQTTLHFEMFNKGGVNRSFKKTHSIGGKGQNFVMACEQYGQHDRVTLLQFVGGMTGTFITQVLEEKNIHQINVRTRKATRTCTTVLDQMAGDMTELIEPTGLIRRQEREELETYAETLIANGIGGLRAIALCGTYPTGISGSTYARIARAKPANLVLLLDAYKDVTEVLSTGQVDIFKINHEELVALVQEVERLSRQTSDTLRVEVLRERSRSPSDAGDRYATMSIPELAGRLLRRYNIRLLGVTNGPESAYLFYSPTHYVIFDLPSLPDLVRTLRAQRRPIPDYSDTASMSSSLPSPVMLDEIGDDIMRLRLSRASTGGSFGLGGRGESDLMNGSGAISPASSAHSERLQRSCNRKDAEAEVLLNPLGAGDTASAVFLMEYIDTRDAVDAFRRGIAAASASCLVTEQTAHFDTVIMDAVYERIRVHEVSPGDIDTDGDMRSASAGISAVEHCAIPMSSRDTLA
ncbi:Ribokinase-like protein [Thamnocephalis sphaerospora]|uniref:Ribokinase-like protein n=1 Tax=Thamnocephalis sphaerospora TaxID=78915 RepID=A0A4P9XIU8_9FUNG|nr:Ribokinase-like protein [Thamnocephalis sphaerospora]|eukprot:RKP05653.1 Ribokinase-like protein [Thamnocephalis sphaerospora]